MKMLHLLMMPLAAVVLGGSSSTGAQPIDIETVLVGNPGNATDPHTGFGAVDHVLAMGKYEVTAGQYTAFLNAVGATDPYGLYDTRMGTHEAGCKIERSGAPGSYAYAVSPDQANRPVNFISWGDAARFTNWLHNGQPTGPPDLTTTEDGSYALAGKVMDKELEDVMRELDATWVLPNEDEWYKAAYHGNDGLTDHYWNYPTMANNGVSNDLIEPDPGNNATFSGPIFGQDYTIGAPYWRTEVGAHENSESAYGTFDQGGNVQEFNETVPEHDIRGIRGGSWFTGDVSKWTRPLDMHSSDQFSDLGFRVANVAPVAVANLRALDSRATYFVWDPLFAGSSTTYDVVRGDLASLTASAGAVELGLLTCIEDDSTDESSQSVPDGEPPAAGSTFFYVVRYQVGSTIGPWGFDSEGRTRSGTGGCPD